MTYLVALAPYSLKSTLFDIKEQVQENAIIPAICYPELKVYESYMDMSKVYNQCTYHTRFFLAVHVDDFKVVRFIKKGKFDVLHTDYMLDIRNKHL